MNAIKNKLLYLLCGVESLYYARVIVYIRYCWVPKLSFQQKVKARNNILELHFCLSLWLGDGGWVIDFVESCLILSKSLINVG